MKAEIITSGTELLLGEIADTNTSFLAAQLAALGIDLHFASVVGDNFDRYSGVLRQAWERADLIITTGGLGPTRGDITREVVAGLLGEEMTVQPDLVETLRGFFTGRGIEMTENNLKQATLIPSATALPNRAGTAPGWWVEKDGRIIVIMPGPPVECQDLWHQQVLPRLRARSGAVILSRTLKLTGVPEGNVDELMAPFLNTANPTLGIYAKGDGIHLRITAKAATQEEAAALAAAREAELRAVIGEHIWGADDDTLESTIGRLLTAKGWTLATAETLSGGQMARLFSEAADSAGFFRGGLVLSGGEADKEQALALAERACRDLGADAGLAVAGDYPPEGDPAPKAAFLGIVTPAGQEAHAPQIFGRPAQYTRRLITGALSYLLARLRE